MLLRGYERCIEQNLKIKHQPEENQPSQKKTAEMRKVALIKPIKLVKSEAFLQAETF